VSVVIRFSLFGVEIFSLDILSGFDLVSASDAADLDEPEDELPYGFAPPIET
jgi:hypothetical protein